MEHKKSQPYLIPEALVDAAYALCITTAGVTWDSLPVLAHGTLTRVQIRTRSLTFLDKPAEMQHDLYRT